MQKAICRSFLAGVCLWVAAASGPALAELTIKKSTNTYEVKGGTAAELHDQMETLGPRRPLSSQRHWARTKWNISWELRFSKQVRSCVVDQVWTTLRLELTLPLWTNKDSASAALKSSWGTAMHDLEAHEQRHADMALTTAKQLDEALFNLGPSLNCGKLGRRANDLGKSLMKELRERSDTYDHETDHGHETITPLRD